MTKPFDLFESIQQDAQVTSPSRANLPGSSEAAISSEMVVSQALAAQHVPAVMDQELAPVHFAADQASVLKSQAIALVGSEPFLREASKAIGPPLAGESEDEFVARAKAALRALLSKLLKR